MIFVIYMINTENIKLDRVIQPYESQKS